jgi:hypothetical protein
MEQRMPSALLVALSHATGVRLSEVAFLLIVIAGVWLAAAAVPRFGHSRARTVVAGVLLATAGVLLVIAVRWGRFG